MTPNKKNALRQAALAGLCLLAAGMIGLTPAGARAGATFTGGPVPDTTRAQAAQDITSGNFTYLGFTVPDFSGLGYGTLTLASSTYQDEFGYAKANDTGGQVVFWNAADNSAHGGASSPASILIAPTISPFVFFFSTGGGSGDPAVTLFTDGHADAHNGNVGQAALAIYEDASTRTYAFFFEDGAGKCTGRCSGGQTDDDFNDLVVTYRVPEPAPLALFGVGVLGTAVMARRRQSAVPGVVG